MDLAGAREVADRADIAIADNAIDPAD